MHRNGSALYVRIPGQECDEAINIFEPTKPLQYGFPFREWSSYGYQRFLVDYKKNIIFPEALFKLPDDYQRLSL